MDELAIGLTNGTDLASNQSKRQPCRSPKLSRSFAGEATQHMRPGTGSYSQNSFVGRQCHRMYPLTKRAG